MSNSIDARAWLIVTILCSCLVMSVRAEDIPRVTGDSPLDRGFNGLYNLDFAGAQGQFSSWEKDHPDDPMGPVSEAAGYLFSEFNRLGVLEAQFYENDKQFDSRKKQAADPTIRDRFTAAISQAETRAQARLNKNPKDRDALFSMTLSAGLKADYAALI